MNNKYVKPFSKAAMWLFLVQPIIITSSQMPWYQQYFSKGNSAEYVKSNAQYVENCKNINTTQNRRGIALLIYLRMTHKKANLDKALSLIQDLLTDFETQLIAAEQETLITIKEKYQVSNEIWQKYLTETQQIKNSYNNGMLQSHPDIIHDPNIPADIRKMFITLLEQNGINPQSIHLKMVTDKKKIDENPNTIGQVISVITPVTTKNDFLFFHDYKPYTIETFPTMIELSSTTKIGHCAHEIQHIIQHHALTKLILTKYLKHYCGIATAEFKKTPEYDKLSQIHEAQAEILSAIKNPKIAKSLKTMRANNYYPDYLYEEHFFNLASIDMLLKVHGWLEFVHQDGFIKIKSEWFNKVTHYTNSLKQLIGC